MPRNAVCSLVLAIALVLACRQITRDGSYAPYPGYRAQVDALLDGRLALTTAPEGLAHDLAWTPHGVQQVWGLGVPLWQLPFELVGRAVGWQPFPDRIALVVWLAVTLLVLLRGLRPAPPEIVEPAPEPHEAPPESAEPAPVAREPRPGRSRRRSPWRSIDRWAFAIGALLLTALLPALVTVLRGRVGIYEEAAIYAYGAAMILFGGLVALHRRPTTGRYLALLAFAGLTGLVRPTAWFYGLATVLVASALLVRLRGRHAVRAVAVGVALFVAGGAVLFATNAERFGTGVEFGHRLNVHSLPGNIVATRFSYPFERAGAIEATEELVGSLFDSPERRSKRGFYQTGLHRGQSPLPRWREYYFTTFSWPYVPVIATGLVLAVLAWRRRGDPFARLVGAWAVLGGAPLFVFYLHSPSVASRYQLDLAPAIAALLVIAWRSLAERWPRRGLAALIALWAIAVATSKTTRPPGVSEPIDREAAARITYELSRAVAHERSLPPAYDLADPFLPTYTGVLTDYARCSDVHGAPIRCDRPPEPGDVALRGHRIDRQWLVDRRVVLVECRAPDPSSGPESGTADAVDADPRCRAPGAGAEAAAIQDLAVVTPPALYLNGSGWDLVTGSVPPATFFYVDDPAYIALDVTGPPGTDWSHAVRVAIGLDHLQLVTVAETAGGARLRFEGGPRRGLQIAFVAFGPDRELAQPQSAFALRSIRWRDQ